MCHKECISVAELKNHIDNDHDLRHPTIFKDVNVDVSNSQKSASSKTEKKSKNEGNVENRISPRKSASEEEKTKNEKISDNKNSPRKSASSKEKTKTEEKLQIQTSPRKSSRNRK